MVKETRILMGMPVTLEIIDESATQKDLDDVYSYFTWVDNKFSTYKKDSEITKFNEGKIKRHDFSFEMKVIFAKSAQTKKETDGYFDIKHNNYYDPSGIVKGWAIYNAAQILKKRKFKNFFVDVGSDIQVYGKNSEGKNWKIGIKNPFNQNQIVKVLSITNLGIATSGTYIRGQHVYNPKDCKPITEILSLTVIGSDIYEADRFATAAFAMGKKGIYFIEELKGFEGYMIDKEGIATQTSNFSKYEQN